MEVHPSAEVDGGPAPGRRWTEVQPSVEADEGPAGEEADGSHPAPAVRRAGPEMIFYFWLWIFRFLKNLSPSLDTPH